MLMQLLRVFDLLMATPWQRPALSSPAFLKIAKRAVVMTVVGGLCGVVYADPAQADAGRPSFLHSVEMRSANLSQFTRWASVMVRAAEEAARAKDEMCRSPESAACRYQEWLQFLNALEGRPKREQLIAVNEYINARAYVPDVKNWGIEDYWATPGEFLARSGGLRGFCHRQVLLLEAVGLDRRRVAHCRRQGP